MRWEDQLASPLVAGRYRIEGALGRGGAAQVLKARDVSTGRPLAIKRLAWNAKARLAAQFELEYRTLASLDHPRIVEVFEYGRDADGAFYTMELLEGEDLRDRAPVTWREACAYLRDASEALSLLHARRLLHRDVSPRNLWRCPDGGVKLIDFGALTPFGPADHLMGTPPFIAPEAFHGHTLDQRADLYSLGALAYYLVTGLHAYPAISPRELPELWQSAPASPSQCVAELARRDLEPVPAEVDALILSLLSHNLAARPASAAEVIDRIDGLLGDERRLHGGLGEIHLQSAQLVGRERELRRLQRQLLLAARGRGRSCLIEGAAGSGRSRLLRELELAARVTDVSVVRVDAAHASGAYGVAGLLGVRLIEALPELARTAAAPHAALLAHCSSQLRERLSADPVRDRKGGAELGVHVQSALRDWILAIAQQRPLVLLIDGLEFVDVGSAAFLVSLASELKNKSILLAATLESCPTHMGSTAERELRRLSDRVMLRPLADGEVLALTESVFGRVEHVARLTSHLQRTARGNPGHLLELCRELLRRNLIAFAAGSWVLPLDLPDDALAGSRNEALLRRLQPLSRSARELGRALSVHDDAAPPALCRVLAEAMSVALPAALDELRALGVITETDEGARFSHDELRRALQRELSAEQTQRLRRVLGDYLLTCAAGAAFERLRAGVHLLAGDDARGADVVADASRKMAISDGLKLGAAVPYLEEALALFRSQERPSYEQLCLLVPLSIAGFRVHRKYAVRHGDAAVAGLQEVLGLDLAVALRPRLGARVSLLLGLARGMAKAHARRGNRRALSFKHAFGMLFNTVAALAASSGTSLDAPAGLRYARVLEPFSAFGNKQVAGFTHEYCVTMGASTSDQPAKTYAEVLRMAHRLRTGRVRGVSPGLHARFLDGALIAAGALEAQRDGHGALERAESLANSRMLLSRLNAEQIRGLYYAHQGNVTMFERHRHLAEQHGIQQGATWQVEAWATCASTAMFMRIHDAMGMKQACEQLQRLSEEIPALALHARRAQGAYLLMRGRYRDALLLLEECLREEPRAVAGWARAMGSLARARNRLADHASAREVCLSVLRRLQPEDLDYPAFHLLAETELLIAEAGLGQVEVARRGIDRLLARHAAQEGPLTLGEIHEAGLEIELILGDRERAAQHFRNMERWYLVTGTPSLVQRAETLGKLIAPSVRGGRQGRDAGGQTSAGERTQTVDRQLAGGNMTVPERALKALEILAGKCGASSGALYLVEGEGLQQCATLNVAQLDPAVEQWLRQRLESENFEEVTQLVEETVEVDSGRDLLAHGGHHHRLLLLTAFGVGTQRLIGAAIVSSEVAPPPACSIEILRVVSHRLRRAIEHSYTTL